MTLSADYLESSTGAGSLAIWTHHFKDITHVPTYRSTDYRGAASKLGADVQGFETMASVRDKGLIVVSDECSTIGSVFAQGGGHSAIRMSFGLAADNVLSWEVVTADAKFIRASTDQKSDLFWTLNGGGWKHARRSSLSCYEGTQRSRVQRRLFVVLQHRQHSRHLL